jgi:glycerol-3-phosphate acyltransferase PlsY
MELTARDVVTILAAYFLGAVPFAYIVTRAVAGVDIRTVGSGNVGATNVSRVLGRKWAICVFALDVLKGFLPVLAARLMQPEVRLGADPSLGVVLTGLAAICGHNWPVYLKFKGGKGVATSCGVFLALFPTGLLVSLAAWGIALWVWRYISVSSIIGATMIFVTALLFQKAPFAEGKWLTAFAAISAALGIVRHHANIRRLMAGTEPKVGKRAQPQG